MTRPGRPMVPRVVVTCPTCNSQHLRREKEADRIYCSKACYHASEQAKETARRTGKALAGRPTNNPFGNGGATKGRPATGRQLAGLAAGWAAVKSGPDNYFWKGGKMSERPHQSSAAHRKWRRQVLARDKCCVSCGTTEQLQADHIKPVMLYPELALDLDNGRALCAPCHRQTDTYAGRVHKMQREVI